LNILTKADKSIANPTPTHPRYAARLALSAEELRGAQQLRFEVFNLELGEGLAESYATGLDVDPFDEFCDHLIVEEIATSEVVGTYRMQTGQLAAANLGYYSENSISRRTNHFAAKRSSSVAPACMPTTAISIYCTFSGGASRVMPWNVTHGS